MANNHNHHNNGDAAQKMQRTLGLCCEKLTQGAKQIAAQLFPEEENGARNDQRPEQPAVSASAAKPVKVDQAKKAKQNKKTAAIPSKPSSQPIKTKVGRTTTTTNTPASCSLSSQKKNKNKKPSQPAPKPHLRGGGGGGRPSSNTNNVSNDEDDPYKDADPSRWKLSEQKFHGSVTYETLGKEETIKGQSIQKAIAEFKANPYKYVALRYQTAMLQWPIPQQQYVLTHRTGTTNFQPTNISASGWMTIWQYQYERLPPFPNNILPKQYRDKYTDNMTFQGRKLHTDSHPPILPGRGMGVCDAPNLKIIGDVDPSDIHQGMVGNCWLLSAISALAEFDGAIKKLYRKTKNLDKMPMDGPNKYIITLCDVRTWKDVDIVIDERLCAAPASGNKKGRTGKLLASKPSVDGELWVCYLEKALAIHCNGWQNLIGGQCTHGWAMLTGCKYQYTIQRNKQTGQFSCFGKYDPIRKQWAKIANSPRDGEQGLWNVPWPRVGGGGHAGLELTEDELFVRLVAWDEENYIVAASTKGTSDKHSTAGLVDNHAYSVIESYGNVCGTGIDLLKVRNPWGKGEIEDGEFDDDGPGWDRYPQIKQKLKPVVADDGIFWVTKQEFFHFFQTIYLSASNMTEFLED